MNNKILLIVIMWFVLLGISQKSLGTEYRLFNFTENKTSDLTVFIYYTSLIPTSICPIKSLKFKANAFMREVKTFEVPLTCSISHILVKGDITIKDGLFSNEQIKKQLKKGFAVANHFFISLNPTKTSYVVELKN